MKKTVSVLLFMIFLSGCVTVSPNMSDRELTVTQAAFVGGVSGAALGRWLGEAINDDPVLGEALGRLLGFTLGSQYGHHVANQKEAFVKQEYYLEACIGEAEKINVQSQEYHAQLTSEIHDLDQQVERLLSAYNSGELKKSELKKEQKYVEAKLEEASKKLERARDELLIQKEVLRREVSSHPKVKVLEDEIAKLEAIVEELSESTEALATINQRMQV